MSIFSSLLFGKASGPSAATQKKFSDALDESQYNANQLGNEFSAAESGFDPEASLDSYAKGAFGNFSTNLGNTLETLKGQEVGQGRFDSGYNDEDTGKVTTQLATNFVNDLNTHALDAAQLKQNNIGMLGQMAQGAQGTYLDLLNGEQDREQAQANAKNQQRSGFINGLLGTAGAVFGARGGK